MATSELRNTDWMIGAGRAASTSTDGSAASNRPSSAQSRGLTAGRVEQARLELAVVVLDACAFDRVDREHRDDLVHEPVRFDARPLS